LPYTLERNEKGEWCVRGPSGIHGCHETRAQAIKQQRALYRNAPEAESSDSGAIMSSDMEASRAPVKDVVLLKDAIRRSQANTEHEVTQAIALAEGLADPEVAAQTVALIGHLADRLKAAELNQVALVDVLQAVARDSATSRDALLKTIEGITERLQSPPHVNLTVPMPGAVADQGKKEITFKHDSSGKISGATVETEQAGKKEVTIERDKRGRLSGATVESE
jgi:hypothetical protein